MHAFNQRQESHGDAGTLWVSASRDLSQIDLILRRSRCDIAFLGRHNSTNMYFTHYNETLCVAVEAG